MARGVWLEPGILDLMVPASEVGVRSVDIYHMVTLYKYSKFEIYMQRNKGDRGISNIGVLGSLHLHVPNLKEIHPVMTKLPLGYRWYQGWYQRCWFPG